MAEPGPRRCVFVHLPVPYLVVPAKWRVGAVTFLPPGRLLQWFRQDRVRRGVSTHALGAYIEEILGEDSIGSTALVPAWTNHLATGQIAEWTYAEARDAARDSIAVLRLFQRSPGMNVDHQLFGLAVDIGAAREHRLTTDRSGRFVSTGVRLHGSIGSWTFSRDDVAAFRADPRLVYLDEALRMPDGQRTEWQRRAVAAVRTLGIGTPLHRPAQRIILAATALEALLGDAYQRGRAGAGAHQLARRGAFVWCGAEFNDPHGQAPRRGACPFLLARDGKDLRRRITAYNQANGGQPVCSYYADLRDLYEDRGAAVHGAEAQFSERLAGRHEYTLEKVIMVVLGWVTMSGATTFEEYERAIAALPAA